MFAPVNQKYSDADRPHGSIVSPFKFSPSTHPFKLQLTSLSFLLIQLVQLN